MMQGYEQEQLAAIYTWHQQAPNRLAQVFAQTLSPVTRVVDLVIPEAAIHAALEAVCSLSERLTTPEAVLSRSGLTAISDIKQSSLELCDRLAEHDHDQAIAVAAAEGGITGAVGLAGIVLDIPSLMLLSLRTIYQIGLCYGFELKGEQGRHIALQIFSLASANSLKEKEAALVSLVAIKQMLQQQTWSQIQQAAFATMGKEAVIVAVRDLAKQLGINLTKRKALAILPVVGAAVGAAINASFIKDIGWAARRTFQEMWLVQQYGPINPAFRISYQPLSAEK